jgi:hypothetical protein
VKPAVHGIGAQRPSVPQLLPAGQLELVQRGVQRVLVTSLPLPQKPGTLHGSTYDSQKSVGAQSASVAQVRTAITHGPQPRLAPGAKHISKRDGSQSLLVWQPRPPVAGGGGAQGPPSIGPPSTPASRPASLSAEPLSSDMLPSHGRIERTTAPSTHDTVAQPGSPQNVKPSHLVPAGTVAASRQLRTISWLEGQPARRKTTMPIGAKRVMTRAPSNARARRRHSLMAAASGRT